MHVYCVVLLQWQDFEIGRCRWCFGHNTAVVVLTCNAQPQSHASWVYLYANNLPFVRFKDPLVQGCTTNIRQCIVPRRAMRMTVGGVSTTWCNGREGVLSVDNH